MSRLDCPALLYRLTVVAVAVAAPSFCAVAHVLRKHSQCTTASSNGLRIMSCVHHPGAPRVCVCGSVFASHVWFGWNSMHSIIACIK
jgi:hypothetical protein